jgi:HEAT repeat protein
MRISLAIIFAVLIARPVPAADPTPLEKSWNNLEAAAKDKSFTRRALAIRVLGLLPGNAKAVEMAEKALTDNAPEVREAGVTALGQMLSYSSIPKLQNALKDKDFSVVLAAAHSLRLLKDKESFETYYEILMGERKTGSGLIADQEKMLRDHKKLAEMGFEEGIGFVPYASMGWEAFKTIHKDDTSPVRSAAAKVLADDPDPRSARALVKASSDKSWVVRTAALDAIARRGDPALLSEIQPRLTDEKEQVRFTAAAAIIRLSGAAVNAGPAGEKPALPGMKPDSKPPAVGAPFKQRV